MLYLDARFKKHYGKDAADLEAAKANPASWEKVNRRDHPYLGDRTPEEWWQLKEQDKEFSMTNRPKLSVTKYADGTFLFCKKTKKFWTLKPGDGNPYWGPDWDRKGVFQPKKSKKAKKSAKEAKKMEVVEVSDDDDEMDDAENAIIDEMNDAENDIIGIVNKMSDGKTKFFLARSIESAFMKVKGMKANASKKRKGANASKKRNGPPPPKGAQPTIFKKPVGRPPKGKQWCTATGKWH